MDMEYQKEFPILYEEAERLADANPNSDQVIFIQTVKGNHYGFANRVLHGDEESEDVFLDMLRDKGDCAIELLVCMWTGDGRGVLQPCYRLQQKLAMLHPQNSDLLLLLEGSQGYIVKDLKHIL